MSEAILIPLWGKIVLFSISKKALLFGAGYLYGFPRLYRRTQKLVRWLAKDQQTRENLHSSVRYGFRLPERLLHWEQRPKTLPSPALTYLRQLPHRLYPLQSSRQVGQSGFKQSSSRRFASIKTSFASSPFVARHAQSWAARREQLAHIRSKYSLRLPRQNLQAVRAGASGVFTSFACKPFALQPAVGLAV